MKDVPLNTGELVITLAALKRPEEILQLFLRLCSDSELAELGLRFQADVMVRKRLPLDEVLNHFTDRADVVARVLIRQPKGLRKSYFPKNKSRK